MSGPGDQAGPSAAEAVESLYPFLYAGQTDLPGVLEQARQSTVAKAHEILQLRRAVSARHGAALRSCAGEAAARFAAGGRLLAFGNGGSATDAQQIATLFLNPGGDARPLPALGLASDTGDVTFNPSTHLVARNLTLMGTLGLENYQDAVVAGRILEAGRLPFERVVSHQLPLGRVADAIEALNSNYRLDGRTALKIAIAPNGPVA